MTEEVEIQEQEPQQQQPDPPKKKLWSKLNTDKLYTKSYEEFELQFNTPEKIDKLYQTLSSQQLYTKSKQEFEQQFFTPEPKKKSSSIVFEESSLPAGNALSQSSGVDGGQIPTIEMYTTPNGEMVEANPIALSKKYRELVNRKTEGATIGGGSFTMGTTSTPTPDEEAQKSAKKLKEDFPDIDFDGIATEVGDLSDDTLRVYGKELMQDRIENRNLYQRKLANLKWREGLQKSLFDDNHITQDEYDRIMGNVQSLASNTGTGDYSNQRNAVRSLAQDIIRYGGENRDKILREFATEISKMYGSAYRNNFDKQVEGSAESKYLDNDEQLALQYLKDISPEMAKQYDSLMVDPKDIKDNEDATRAYNHLKQTLKETAISLQQSSITEELDNLRNQAEKNGGLSETQLQQATELELKQEELTQKRAELDKKYPDRVENKIENAMQNIFGEQKLGWGSYAIGSLLESGENTVEGIWDAVATPFRSDASQMKRELVIMGDKLEADELYSTLDKNKALQHDKLVIDKDLQAMIDAIVNDKNMSLQQKKSIVRGYLKDSPDKFGRVPVKGGEWNINPASIAYSFTDLGTTLAPFIALEAVTGGGATAGLARKFASTFSAAAATTFHDEYANALLQGKRGSDAYKEAMVMTTISSLAMAGAATPAKVRALINPKTSAGQLIKNMSDDAIQKVLDKGTPKGLRGIKQAFTDRLKATPKMLGAGAKTGGEFEVAMTAANELKHQLYDTEIDREANFKHSLVAIGNFAGLGLMGHFNYKTPTEMQKGAGLLFGEKPKDYISVAQEMRKNGQLTEAEFNHRVDLITKFGEAYKTVPKDLSESKKADYLYQTVIKNEATKGKSDLPPKQAAEAEHTALVADYERGLILKPLTEKQLESTKSSLEKKLELKDKEGQLVLNDKERKEVKAELQAIENTIENNKIKIPEPPKVEGEPEKISKPVELVTEVEGKPEEISQPIELSVEEKPAPKNSYAETYNEALKNPETRELALEEISEQWHDPRSRKLIEESIAPEIIEEAKQKYPKQETTLTIEENKVFDTETQASPTASTVSEVTPETKTGEEGGKKPPPKEPIEPVEGGEGESNLPERRFTKQMLNSDELSDVSKAEIGKTLNYVRQSHEMTLKEANEVIDKVGLNEAQNLVIGDNELKPVVRNAVGMILIKKFNELSEKSTDKAEKQYYLDKSIQTATAVTERYGTEAGQSIEIFKLWSQLSPEGQLRAANQDMARQGKEKLRRREKDINTIGSKFQKANEEAANEVTKSEKVKKPKAKTAEQKISDAQKKRDEIKKKHQQNKGKNLYSGVGLTKEGIEYVGEMTATYIQEGVAKLEIIVDKIIKELKDLTGKDPDKSVRENVKYIVRERLSGIEKERKEVSEEDRIKKGVSDLEGQINKIIKEHYTIPEEAKKKLVDKFIEQAGLNKEEAQRLSKEVETEFDRIATRKKRDILYHEKARFDKINNTLKGAKTPEKKTVADEIIKYSNLGAFDGKEFTDMMASKFGVGEISTEQAAKLLELANKVKNAPDGSPKNEATERLLAYRAKLKGNDWGEVAQAAWYANVLSGYKTHKKNLISTFFNSMGELGAQMVKDPKAIPYLMVGYFKGLGQRGLIEGAHTLSTGLSPIHIKKIETPNALERVKFKGGYLNPFNGLKYIMRLMIAEDVLSFQALKEARAYQLARSEAAKMGYNTYSKKGWEKVNELLLNTKERQQEAIAQVKEEGLIDKKGKLTLEGTRRMYELMENSRPTKMVEDTYGFAAHGTFNHESEGALGGITNAVASALDAVNVGGVKPARFIVPFTRIITNVVNNSLDYTPIGLVRGIRGVRGFRSFENNRFTKGAFKELTADERKTYIAKAAIGITLAATFQAMHQAGIIQITGAGTGDNKKDEQLRQSGWQEYSIKVGDTYISYKYTPLIFMLGFLGNMNDASKYSKEDEDTINKQMEIALSRLGGQVGEMTWINSASTFLGALTEKNTNQQINGLNKAMAGMVRGFLPYSGAITQTTQATDNYFGYNKKQTENAWQALIASIPIARNSINDKINALGDPIKTDTDVFASTETKDPVWKFLLDNKGWVAPVNKNTIIIYDQKTQEDRPLTADEYFEFSKKRGKKIKEALQAKMKEYGWDEITGEGENETSDFIPKDKIKPEQFNKWLTEIEEKATKETKEELFGEQPVNPSIKYQ